MTLFRQILKSIREQPDHWRVADTWFYFCEDGRTTPKSADLKIDISNKQKYHIEVANRGRIAMTWWQDVKFAEAFKEWITRPMEQVLKVTK